MSAVATAPAKRLIGFELPNGWRVVEKLDRKATSTGGMFSTGYIVEKSNGKRAFLKAIDLSDAFGSPDPVLAINATTESYLFERDLLDRCRMKRLDRVVQAIDHGRLGSAPNDLVFYLIFELADCDIREQISAARRIDLAWRFKILHHVATGLRQLHGQGIAHQDIKPSNVLVFRSSESKLGDLGRAASRAGSSPHEAYAIAGDWTYAPPELLYGFVPGEWNQRRLGCDLYLLGSMVVYVFLGLGATPLLMMELDPAHRCNAWHGDYRDVLPFVRDAFSKLLLRFSEAIPEALREEVTGVVAQLCDPDPDLRGHHRERTRHGNPHSLERYISKFDLLARRAVST